jgi:hypothetical protein
MGFFIRRSSADSGLASIPIAAFGADCAQYSGIARLRRNGLSANPYN